MSAVKISAVFRDKGVYVHLIDDLDFGRQVTLTTGDIGKTSAHIISSSRVKDSCRQSRVIILTVELVKMPHLTNGRLSGRQSR